MSESGMSCVQNLRLRSISRSHGARRGHLYLVEHICEVFGLLNHKPLLFFGRRRLCGHGGLVIKRNGQCSDPTALRPATTTVLLYLLRPS
eukprot:3140781-Rhodomonas_salina.1